VNKYLVALSYGPTVYYRWAVTLLITRRHCKINNFTCGQIYDFDVIVNCDKSDQRHLILRYLSVRVVTEVRVGLRALELEYLYL